MKEKLIELIHKIKSNSYSHSSALLAADEASGLWDVQGVFELPCIHGLSESKMVELKIRRFPDGDLCKTNLKGFFVETRTEGVSDEDLEDMAEVLSAVTGQKLVAVRRTDTPGQAIIHTEAIVSSVAFLFNDEEVLKENMEAIKIRLEFRDWEIVNKSTKKLVAQNGPLRFEVTFIHEDDLTEE